MPAATWCWSATRNWSMKPCTRCRPRPQYRCAAGPDRPRRAGWDGLLADARHGDTQSRLLETLGRTV
jgi:hypothetical protein